MSQKHKMKDRQVFIKKEPEVPEFRCIININTNIYEKKRRCGRHRSHSKTQYRHHSRSEIKKYPLKSDVKIKERIVPLCMRDKRCNGGRSSFLNMSDNTLSKRSHTKTDRHCCKCRRHIKKEKHERHGRKDKKTEKSFLSPISSHDLSDSDMTYESISSDTVVDSDYEINKLIQRTKNLERHTDIFQLKPETFSQYSPDRFTTSTPCENLHVMQNSETDVGSIHSAATVKLETNSLKNHSWNSNETLNLSIYDQDETLVFSNENENIEIKQEPNYSPSPTPNAIEHIAPMHILNTKTEIDVKEEGDVNQNYFCVIKQEAYSPCNEWSCK